MKINSTNFSPYRGRLRGSVWKIMRVAMIQITVALVFAGLAIAHPNNAQEVLKREVSLKLTEVTLEKALAEIETKVGVKFGYSRNKLNLDVKVSMDASKQKLGDVLDALLVPHAITYAVQENEEYIILTEKNDQSSVPEERQPAEQQLVAAISGKVTFTDGSGMPGVNVVVKGTTKGTSTNAQGVYTIDANEGDVLVFSFIGFKTLESTVGSQSVIDVTLEEDIATLGEVVVNAGYWTVKEREQTGNISRITAEEIQKQPVSNPLAALIGRMPGVYVQQISGTPGGGFNIHIRGQNSLRADGNYPLYIVDGVPFPSTPLGSDYSNNITQRGSPLNNINPASIESIEILKDADATAIYGSRGANGVVLITTKRGSAEKTQFDVNFYQGVGKVTKMMDLLNSQQYLEMRHEAFKNDGETPGTTNPDYDLLAWDTTRHTDWQKELIGGTANFTNLQASLSGGNTNTQFLIGLGFYRETTVLPAAFADRKISARINVNHTSNNRKFNINYSNSNLIDDNRLPLYDPTSAALLLPPTAPAIYDSLGFLNWEDNTFDNPYAPLMQQFNSRTFTTINNAALSYEIIPGLQVRLNLGYTQVMVKENNQQPVRSQRPDSGTTTGYSTFTDKNIATWIVEPQITYTRNLFKGKLTTLVGATLQETQSASQSIQGSGYVSDDLLASIRSAAAITLQNATDAQYRYGAWFARINYDWQSKYFINLTGRRDGSSRFGPGKQMANFGAIGLAWLFSNEGFVKNNLSFLSFGKLRGSYGVTGSDQISDYQFLAIWTPTRNPYAGRSAYVPSNLKNPDFAWEENTKLEAAIELGFLSNRVVASASHYRNRSANQLVGYTLPATTGFPSITANFPAEVENKGIELELETTNIQNGLLTWKTYMNFTKPTNALIAFPGLETSSYRYQYEIGRPTSVYKAFHYSGVAPATGLNTYADYDNDGEVFDDDDYVGLKQISQKYFGGINNSLNIKGFQLDIFFQFVKQTGFDYHSTFGAPGTMSNQPDVVLNRWREGGSVTDIQRFTQNYGEAYEAYAIMGDRVVQDASFIRLKNVSLSYSFSRAKAKIQNCRIYIQGQNLITFTNYIGLDPEQQNVYALPPLRAVTAGIQITL